MYLENGVITLYLGENVHCEEIWMSLPLKQRLPYYGPKYPGEQPPHENPPNRSFLVSVLPSS